jgi:hypothetical protein
VPVFLRGFLRVLLTCIIPRWGVYHGRASFAALIRGYAVPGQGIPGALQLGDDVGVRKSFESGEREVGHEKQGCTELILACAETSSRSSSEDVPIPFQKKIRS